MELPESATKIASPLSSPSPVQKTARRGRRGAARGFAGGRRGTALATALQMQAGYMKRASLPGFDQRQRLEAQYITRYLVSREMKLVPEEVFCAVGARFDYAVAGSWQRARCAALAAACLELEKVSNYVRGGVARRLVSARFDRLALGKDALGTAYFLELGPLTLWRAFRLWRAALVPSPSVIPFRRFSTGRPPKLRKAKA